MVRERRGVRVRRGSERDAEDRFHACHLEGSFIL